MAEHLPPIKAQNVRRIAQFAAEHPEPHMSLPTQGEFGVDERLVDELAASPWTGFIRVPIYEERLSMHPGAFGMLSGWLGNREHLVMQDQDGAVRLIFVLEDGSPASQRSVDRLALAAGQALGCASESVEAHIGYSDRLSAIAESGPYPPLVGVQLDN